MKFRLLATAAAYHYINLLSISVESFTGGTSSPYRHHRCLTTPPNPLQSTPRYSTVLHVVPLPNTNNPFIILGLAAPTRDKLKIKRAYKQCAIRYHPDRRCNPESTASEKKIASDEFARVNAAYALLTADLEKQEEALKEAHETRYRHKSVRTRGNPYQQHQGTGNSHWVNDQYYSGSSYSGSWTGGTGYAAAGPGRRNWRSYRQNHQSRVAHEHQHQHAYQQGQSQSVSGFEHGYQPPHSSDEPPYYPNDQGDYGNWVGSRKHRMDMNGTTKKRTAKSADADPSHSTYHTKEWMNYQNSGSGYTRTDASNYGQPDSFVSDWSTRESNGFDSNAFHENYHAQEDIFYSNPPDSHSSLEDGWDAYIPRYNVSDQMNQAEKQRKSRRFEDDMDGLKELVSFLEGNFRAIGTEMHEQKDLMFKWLLKEGTLEEIRNQLKHAVSYSRQLENKLEDMTREYDEIKSSLDWLSMGGAKINSIEKNKREKQLKERLKDFDARRDIVRVYLDRALVRHMKLRMRYEELEGLSKKVPNNVNGNEEESLSDGPEPTMTSTTTTTSKSKGSNTYTGPNPPYFADMNGNNKKQKTQGAAQQKTNTSIHNGDSKADVSRFGRRKNTTNMRSTPAKGFRSTSFSTKSRENNTNKSNGMSWKTELFNAHGNRKVHNPKAKKEVVTPWEKESFGSSGRGKARRSQDSVKGKENSIGYDISKDNEDGMLDERKHELEAKKEVVREYLERARIRQMKLKQRYDELEARLNGANIKRNTTAKPPIKIGIRQSRKRSSMRQPLEQGPTNENENPGPLPSSGRPEDWDWMNLFFAEKNE